MQRCAGEWHNAYRKTAIGASIVICVGLPWACVTVLIYGMRGRKLHDDSFLTMFGVLYARYKGRYWWWEVVIFVRRGIFVMGAVYFSDSPLQGLLFSLLICSLSLYCNLLLCHLHLQF